MAALATSPDAGPEIARELLANCERPFDDARAMPPQVYTSDAFLALEHREIFRKQWLCVGRASTLQQSW